MQNEKFSENAFRLYCSFIIRDIIVYKKIWILRKYPKYRYFMSVAITCKVQKYPILPGNTIRSQAFSYIPEDRLYNRTFLKISQKKNKSP